jgi:acetyl-CoA C-acetyltransferase
MREVVVVDAVRTPFGKRGGAYAGAHSVEVLGAVLETLLSRSALAPSEVDQVIGGCVQPVGMQAANVTRGAWLTAGLPVEVAATTVDTQCGSSQQATTLGHTFIASGMADVVVACGVELMTRIPMGSIIPKEGNLGRPVTRAYWEHHEYTSQFEGAERIADNWSITREDCDVFGKKSQDAAARAQLEDRFATHLISVEVPVVDEGGAPNGEVVHVTADEGPRPTSLEKLATLKPTGRPDGVHTAGTSSQISDGASAVLLMSREKANALGLTPMATIVDSCLVGSDPVLMLTGPIIATQKLLKDNKLTVNDLDVVEINEAFASVVLAWQRELDVENEIINPNGGAIALGHPLGATGASLVAKAVHELARTDGEHALVTMCCGGGLGTGTLLRRTA